MRCPKCSSLDNKVVDSRSSRGETSIRRRRHCNECDHRFTTYEVVEQEMPIVLKRSGTTQEYDHRKVLGGMTRSCEKRPVALSTLEASAEEIRQEILESAVKELPSRSIGARVLQKLGEIDPVARIRFASIHRDFSDVDDFLDEIENIDIPNDDGSQPELSLESPANK